MVDSHIIPRHYLKHFANASNCIIIYPDPDSRENTNGNCIKHGGQTLKKTAVIPDYYTDATETAISIEIEQNGHWILKKILEKTQITPEEKEMFAKYVLSFRFRGSIAKKHTEILYEEEFNKRVSNPDEFCKFKEEYNYPNLTREEWITVLERIYSEDSDLKEKFWEDGIMAEHKRPQDNLLAREWWILETIGDLHFITSDNPLYLADSGMENQAQITFPLSKKMAIIFDGTGNPSNLIKYYSIGLTQHNLVDEINKRTADKSEKLYSSKKELHLPKLVGYNVSNPQIIRRPL